MRTLKWLWAASGNRTLKSESRKMLPVTLTEIRVRRLQ